MKYVITLNSGKKYNVICAPNTEPCQAPIEVPSQPDSQYVQSRGLVAITKIQSDSHIISVKVRTTHNTITTMH